MVAAVTAQEDDTRMQVLDTQRQVANPVTLANMHPAMETRAAQTVHQANIRTKMKPRVAKLARRAIRQESAQVENPVGNAELGHTRMETRMPIAKPVTLVA